MELDSKKQRYLRDGFEVRLGGIAANLARVRSFGRNRENGDRVEALLRECRFFIEWAAPDVSLEVAMELLELQRLLTVWLLAWGEVWSDDRERALVLEGSKDWSDRLLVRSGLV